MRKRDYLDYIQDILDATMDVENFVKGMSLDDFMNDKKTISGWTCGMEGRK